MLKKYRIIFLILAICCIELGIYLWAVYTIEPFDFIFGKAARNSGRLSAALNLTIIAALGYYGLKKIYADEQKKELFKLLVTIFAINHLIHFIFIFQNFKLRSENLDLTENAVGVYTFIVILLLPIFLWTIKNLNPILYLGVIIFIFSSTYFMILTFLGKISPEGPHYLHQIGIGIMILGLASILFRIVLERLAK